MHLILVVTRRILAVGIAVFLECGMVSSQQILIDTLVAYDVPGHDGEVAYQRIFYQPSYINQDSRDNKRINSGHLVTIGYHQILSQGMRVIDLYRVSVDSLVYRFDEIAHKHMLAPQVLQSVEYIDIQIDEAYDNVPAKIEIELWSDGQLLVRKGYSKKRISVGHDIKGHLHEKMNGKTLKICVQQTDLQRVCQSFNVLDLDGSTVMILD